MEQGTALAVVNGEQPKQALVKAPLMAGSTPRAIVPVDFDGAYRIANVVVQAGMAPSTLGTVEKAMVAILHGLEVGLTPMNALQSIAVINGKPTIWGDGAIGLIRASGLLEYMEEYYENEDTPTMKAVCVVKRKGEPKPVKSDFSMADARTAGLLNKQGPWQTYPKRMLKMRARWPLRDTFSDVLKGLQLREEAEDIERDVSPQMVVANTDRPAVRRPPPPPPVEGEKPVETAKEPEKAEGASNGSSDNATKSNTDPISSGPAGSFPGDKKLPAPTAAQDGAIPWALDRKLSDSDRDWLMTLKEAFEQCSQVEEIGAEQDSIMMPVQGNVSAYVWQKAVDLVAQHIERING